MDLRPFPEDLRLEIHGRGYTKGRYNTAIMFVRVASLGGDTHVMGFPVRAKLLEDCEVEAFTRMVSKEVVAKYPIVGAEVLPAKDAPREEYLACLPPYDTADVMNLVNMLQERDSLYRLLGDIKSLHLMPDMEERYLSALFKITDYVKTLTGRLDAGYIPPDTKAEYPEDLLDEITFYWAMYHNQEEDPARSETDIAAANRICTANIKACSQDMNQLPHVADIQLKVSDEHDHIIDEIIDVIMALGNLPASIDLKQDAVAGLWVACHESPFAPHLLAALQESGIELAEVLRGVMRGSNQFGLPEVYGLCLRYPPTEFEVPFHEIGSENNMLERLSLRERRFIYDHKNWQHINDCPSNYPFILDWNDEISRVLIRELGPGAAKLKRDEKQLPNDETAVPPPMSAAEQILAEEEGPQPKPLTEGEQEDLLFWRNRLHFMLGFDPEELDLSQSAITGSATSFVFAPEQLDKEYSEHIITPLGVMSPIHDDFSSPHRTLFNCKDPILPFGAITPEGTLQVLHYTSETESTELELKHMHDIDIAVIANTKSRYGQEVQDELDEIVHRHYEVFKRHYPHCQLKKLDRGPATGGFQNYNWAIYTQDREEFARLPTIEFYPSTLAGICSHHVAPVRTCWTAAYQPAGLPQRPIMTASAYRAHLLRELNDFNYFASHKTFPQEIIVKYIRRGYGLGPHCPRTIVSEIGKFLGRNPRQAYAPVIPVGSGYMFLSEESPIREEFDHNRQQAAANILKNTQSPLHLSRWREVESPLKEGWKRKLLGLRTPTPSEVPYDVRMPPKFGLDYIHTLRKALYSREHNCAVKFVPEEVEQAAMDEWKALTEAGTSLQDARSHFIQIWKTAGEPSGEEALTLMIRTMPKFGP